MTNICTYEHCRVIDIMLDIIETYAPDDLVKRCLQEEKICPGCYMETDCCLCTKVEQDGKAPAAALPVRVRPSDARDEVIEILQEVLRQLTFNSSDAIKEKGICPSCYNRNCDCEASDGDNGSCFSGDEEDVPATKPSTVEGACANCSYEDGAITCHKHYTVKEVKTDEHKKRPKEASDDDEVQRERKKSKSIPPAVDGLKCFVNRKKGYITLLPM